MTPDYAANARALKLYELALAVLRVKGTVKLDGLDSGLEYRGRSLTIHSRAEPGQLDVWCGRRVLSIERFAGRPQVIPFVPGHWELRLIEAAKVAA
jgi:hypothetical protein